MYFIVFYDAFAKYKLPHNYQSTVISFQKLKLTDKLKEQDKLCKLIVPSD